MFLRMKKMHSCFVQKVDVGSTELSFIQVGEYQKLKVLWMI